MAAQIFLQKQRRLRSTLQSTQTVDPLMAAQDFSLKNTAFAVDPSKVSKRFKVLNKHEAFEVDPSKERNRVQKARGFCG